MALGNLYHPDKIDVPGKLVAGALAAGNLLKFDALIKGTIEKMSNSLTKKTISECYNVCKKVIELFNSLQFDNQNNYFNLSMDIKTPNKHANLGWK